MARLTPLYSTPEPNRAIQLYEGEIGLGQEKHPGSIRFDWFPSPKIRFEIPEYDAHIRPGNVALSLPCACDTGPAFVSSVHASSNRPTIVSGFLSGQLDLGSPSALKSVIFHVPNFKRYYTMRDSAPPEILANDYVIDRMVMEAEGWKITLEALEDAEQLIKTVNALGGYAITHVGKLERSDGSPFSIDEAGQMLGILAYFLSFVRGYWVNTLFPVGFDANGVRCWERWGPWRFDSWRTPRSWCDQFHGEGLGQAFPGFLSRWRNPLWQEPIRLGAHWYIECNRGGSDSESRIVLTQAALELLVGHLPRL